MLLATSLCINELFTMDTTITSMCDIARSHYQQSDISHVVNNIWIFDVTEERQYCKFDSQKHESGSILVIDEPTILQLPCEEYIRCSNLEIPSSLCAASTILVNTNKNRTYQQQPNFQLSLKNLKSHFVSAYKTQLRGLLKEIQTFENDDLPLMKRILQHSTGTIQSIFSLLVITIVVTLGKYFQSKIQNRVDRIDRRINKFSDIFLPNDPI